MAPTYEPEVNVEQDILDQAYKKIYVWNADNVIHTYFFHVHLSFPDHYKLVSMLGIYSALGSDMYSD